MAGLTARRDRLPPNALHHQLSGPVPSAALARLVGIALLAVWSITSFGVLLTSACLGWVPVGGVVLVAMSGLWLCTLAYLLARIGTEQQALRLASAVPPPMPAEAPSVTILIPSYCEEPHVIGATLLSAALAPYPSRNIVVLIDDPPGDDQAVGRSFAAVDAIRDLIAPRRKWIDRARSDWLNRRAHGKFDVSGERQRLMALLYALADWYEDLSNHMPGGRVDHVDAFFSTEILGPLARSVRTEAGRVLMMNNPGEFASIYQSLADHLCTDITAFQRKRFANLSHAPNKAMNLNAYIGLMGQRFLIRSRERQEYLRPAPALRRDLEVPAVDFVLTLDADSVIRSNYLQALVPIMAQDPRIAVAQTPYLSFPGSRSPVERIAGATTDVQFLAHQGSTSFGACFWVGANALIRTRALQDIRTTKREGAKEVQVFVQDRTVIEDTGSTIDLLSRGWRLHNHFAPLAYSATPADFGALSIQRKRWSNGGLVILPSLLRAIWIAPRGSFRPSGVFLQLHYLISPAVGNLSILFLMLGEAPDDAAVALMVLSVLPYFVLYAIDLQRLGYRLHDLFRVMSLNMLLLPVALAGVLESLVQILIGQKANFVRTPKVDDRTRVPVAYILFHAALLGFIGATFAGAMDTLHPVSLLALAANAGLLAYGLGRFIGLHDVLRDMSASVHRRQQGHSIQAQARIPALANSLLPEAKLPAVPRAA